jgi:predicted nucleic acid-binding protein
MSGKFFLDTNVFIYAADKTDFRKRDRAEDLIRSGVTSRRGIVSLQVAQEFLNFALRKAEVPMSNPDAEEYLRVILKPMLVQQPPELLLKDALHLHSRYRLSWYDSLIVAAAMEQKCAVLYTEDLQHGQRFGNLEIRNPFL